AGASCASRRPTRCRGARLRGRSLTPCPASRGPVIIPLRCWRAAWGGMELQAAELLDVMKEQLAAQLSRSKYELLIRPLKALSCEDGVLLLTTSNEVLRGWLLDQFSDLLSELAQLAAGVPLRVEVAVESPSAAA